MFPGGFSQLAEHPDIFNVGGVEGSSLYAGYIFSGGVAQLAEQRPFKPWVEGSNPSALIFPLREKMSFEHNV